MKIYEIELNRQSEDSLLHNTFHEVFVIIAENFDEAKKIVDKYIKNYPKPREYTKKHHLIIKSIDEKYIIRSMFAKEVSN